MPQFCILFYANYTFLATQWGVPLPSAPPPKYAHGCGPNEKGEDQKKRSLVQKFPQIFVDILRFSTNSKLKTKKKRKKGLCP